MHALVNGVRLFFDVEGAQFVPDVSNGLPIAGTP